jgi:glycosidase
MQSRKITLLLIFLITLTLTACTQPISDNYRTTYEVFVRSFYDGDGDGFGDLKGLTLKLDYIEKDLGADALWLMPIMPSPTYHKYDVTDYYAIDPSYGTLADFDALTAELKKRDMKLNIDLVLNHTSTQHPWFISAVKSLSHEPCGQEVCPYEDLCPTHNPYVTYYNFTKEPLGKGYYNLHMPSGWFYEAVFWDQMPDLNLDNPELRSELLKIAKFWIDHGVTGFRLDAVLHFYREDTAKNVAFLKWFNTEVKAYSPTAYIVGEAWADTTTVTRYYDSGIDSLFHFDLSGPTGKLVDTIRSGDGKSFIQSVADYQATIRASNPAAIDALFLSNHDQARSAGFLMADPVKQKLAASLYLLLPGNSFIYYGEELGQFGSGKDENKRLPMIWSTTDTKGMTTPLNHSEAITPITEGASEQLKNQESLLVHYQKILALKHKYSAIARGSLTPLELGDTKVFGYTTTYENTQIYVLHNLTADAMTINFPKAQYAYDKIVGDLSAGSIPSSLTDDSLVIQGYSTVVIQ